MGEGEDEGDIKFITDRGIYSIDIMPILPIRNTN
jgi:hypothetical protein